MKDTVLIKSERSGIVQLLIPVISWSVVNVPAAINEFRLICLDTSSVSREEVYLLSFNVVNCLLK